MHDQKFSISILRYEVAPSFTGNVMITCSNELDNRCGKNMMAIGRFLKKGVQ